MKLLLFAILVIGCCVCYCTGGPPDVQYIVAIDAGSAGSRAIAYKFHINHSNKKITIDDEEKCAKIDGGLGSYVKNPAEGAEKIRELLGMIKQQLHLDPEVLKKTPVILGATGGLRNLQPEEAQNLLAEVMKMFRSSGFLVKENAATIINGIDEGIFSWFTTNYILGLWGSKSAVAVVDVGGASTELAFPRKKKSTDRELNDHLYSVSTSIPKSKTDIFSISYSNLGLVAMRKTVVSHGNAVGSTDLHTICMHPNSKQSSFKFGDKSYNVYGVPNENSKFDFDACMTLVKEKTLSFLTPKASLKNENEIYMPASFLSLLVKIGLIDSEDGGQITLKMILETAEKLCIKPNDKYPFLCFDFIYIYVLLHDGLELESATKINLFQKLKGRNTSWTLGLAYDQLTGVKREKKTIRKKCSFPWCLLKTCGQSKRV